MLVPFVVECNIFNTIRWSKIPVAVKCMVALRILGRGSSCDDICEMSGVGESTVNSIFKQFIFGMSRPDVFTRMVKPPSDERLKAEMDLALFSTFKNLQSPFNLS